LEDRQSEGRDDSEIIKERVISRRASENATVKALFVLMSHIYVPNP
jgi:hypothetical protein